MDKKTVNIINFHFAHNYGAILESFALYKSIEKMGFDVKVIDYHPHYLAQFYEPHPNPFKSFYYRFKMLWQKNFAKRLLLSFKWFLYTIYSNKNNKKKKTTEAAFKPFRDKHLSLTRRYNSYKQLKKNPPVGSYYVCGSDQVWNCLVTSGFDPAYFLEFGDENIKRVAYAPSPCQGLDIDKFKKDLERALPKFSSISLREAERVKDIESIYNHKVDVCVDPTFLLTPDDYAPCEEPIEDENYILVYAFKEANDSRMVQSLHNLVNELKLKVVDISFEGVDWGVDVIKRENVTPGQFLTYFKNAKYVLTNSFHGTAFSIIYQKQFASVTKAGTQERMIGICKAMHLENALIEDILVKSNEVKYDSAFEKGFNELREKSLEYLKNSLK